MKTLVTKQDGTHARTLLKHRLDGMSEKMSLLPISRLDDLKQEDKRVHPRMPCTLLVDYATQDCAYRVFVKNISPDGAFIESHGLVPTGPEITLVLSFLDDQNPVKIAGEIAWTGEGGIGVRFKTLS